MLKDPEVAPQLTKVLIAIIILRPVIIVITSKKVKEVCNIRTIITIIRFQQLQKIIKIKDKRMGANNCIKILAKILISKLIQMIKRKIKFSNQ